MPVRRLITIALISACLGIAACAPSPAAIKENPHTGPAQSIPTLTPQTTARPTLTADMPPTNTPGLTNTVSSTATQTAPDIVLPGWVPEGARARIGEGRINHIAVSPDGDIVAVAGTVGVFLYRVDDFQRVWKKNTTQAVKYAAFSPDGRTLAISINSGFIYLLDASTGGILLSINLFKALDVQLDDMAYSGRSLTAESLSFSPDGKIIAFGRHKRLLLFDTLHGQLLQSVANSDLGEYPRVAFSPDGSIIAAGSDADGSIILWKVMDEKPAFFLEGHSSAVTGLSWSPDSKILASASVDQTVQLWDAASGKRLRQIRESSPITGLEFSRDGSGFVIGTSDGSIAIWDAIRENSVHFLTSVDEPITDVMYSGPGAALLAASWNRILLWDLSKFSFNDSETQKPVRILTEFQYPSLSAEYLASTGEIAASTLSASLAQAQFRVLDPVDGKTMRFVSIPSVSTVSRKYDKYAELTAAGRIRISEASTGKVLKTLGNVEIGEGWHVGINFSPDDNVLAATMFNQHEGGSTVRVWDTRNGTLLREFTNLSWGLHGVIFSSDGNLVIIMDGGQSAAIYEIRGGKKLDREIYCHDGGPQRISFSPDDSLFLFVCSQLVVGKVDTGEFLGTFGEAGFRALVFAASFDSRRVAVTRPDETWIDRDAIEVWDLWEKSLLFTFRGHNGKIHSLSFSPDGKTLASTGEDGTVILWNVEG